MSNKNLLIQVRDWKVYTNRARAIIEPSILAAEQYLGMQHPTIQQFCNKQIRDTTLTYFDTYQGVDKPSLTEPEVDTPIAVRMSPRPITNQLSDKLKLAKSIEEHQLFAFAPRTYFSKEEAAASAGDPERLLFIKLRSGTRGEHVVCVKHKDLAGLDFVTKHHIIQEEISNPTLLLGRKFVLRFYIFIFNQQIFLSKHGVVVIHGEPYDKNSTDYKIHIQHNGEGVSAIRVPFYKLPDMSMWFEKLKGLTSALQPVLEVARKDSSLFRYLVIGADAIPCQDGTVRLVEFNTHPSIVNEPMVTPVYVPMFSSVMLAVVAGIYNDSFVKIF
jgi:hypothetical protein